MDFYARLARSIGLLLLVASGGAHASELMRMPFDCRFDGAQVRLRPSEDRTYTVIGRREREVFTTCSPAEPDRCSSWLVHRFDFDCDGDRVAWIDAAAAATRFADWDAWIEDGRFRMRMDPLWGVARARPFRARRRLMRQRYLDPDAGDPFGRGEGDVYGARIVTVPPGFAPAVAIPLTFSGGAPEMAEAPDAPAPDAPAQEAPAVADYQSAPEAEPVPDLPERAPPQEPNLAATAPPPVVVPAPRAVTSSEAVSTEKSPAPSAPANETDAHAADATTASETPQGHTVINGPRPVPTEAASPAAPATTSAQSAIAAARIETSAVAPPVAIRPQPPAAPAAPSDTTLSAVATPVPAPSESATLPSIAMPALSMETAAAAAATMLALAGLAVFGFLRWRRRPQPAVLKRGDIGDISLGGGHKGLTYERAAAVPEAPADASPPGREASEGTSELPVPTTYAEALEVLGASPDSSTAAIKKIVDGLRQSWHPDLARSETDRLHREARVRQINVAWDLVSQRRSAA